MKVVLVTPHEEFVEIEVNGELRISDLKSLCEHETGFTKDEIGIYHDGIHLISEETTIHRYGIADGDFLIVKKMPKLRSILKGSKNNPGPSYTKRDSNEASRIRDLLLRNPHHMASLKENNPTLYKALASGNLDEFTNVLNYQLQERDKLKRKRERLLQAHPFDTVAQKQIADEIRHQNVQANMEAAMEYNPESFGVVVMLYINCLVNGYPVKAFVDSGAQTTIMSVDCAERVCIMHLVDKRWAGVARGLGVQKIIGRVHMVKMIIEDVLLTTSFSVIENQPMDMLLGLDMLKRHQCYIDLKKNVLRIGTTGTETPFLSETEIPECATRVWPQKEQQKKK